MTDYYCDRLLDGKPNDTPFFLIRSVWFKIDPVAIGCAKKPGLVERTHFRIMLVRDLIPIPIRPKLFFFTRILTAKNLWLMFHK